jgi:iron complex transport system ATP-binding protein
MAFVPQAIRLEFPFTAEQVVFMGRTPYCHGLFESPEDREAVRRAMDLTDSLRFAKREFPALSGGEKQRVVLAGALAQNPSVLLLDEPTTFLDLKHQISIYGLLRDLARGGMAVIAVTHDLNLAASYADRMIVISKGTIASEGPPANILRADLLREVFEVDVEIRGGPDGRPWVFYDQAPRDTAHG